MGYCTEFTGEISIDKPLDDATKALLKGLNSTRRVKRDLSELAKIHALTLSEAQEKWGEDGEWYVEKSSAAIVNNNKPPSTQPSLSCCWRYNEDFQSIEWDNSEKADEYVEWMEYLITKILAPRGYTLNGIIYWDGEDRDDMGRIIVKNNKVTEQTPTVTWPDTDSDADGDDCELTRDDVRIAILGYIKEAAKCAESFTFLVPRKTFFLWNTIPGINDLFEDMNISGGDLVTTTNEQYSIIWSKNLKPWCNTKHVTKATWLEYFQEHLRLIAARSDKCFSFALHDIRIPKKKQNRDTCRGSLTNFGNALVTLNLIHQSLSIGGKKVHLFYDKNGIPFSDRKLCKVTIYSPHD